MILQSRVAAVPRTCPCVVLLSSPLSIVIIESNYSTIEVQLCTDCLRSTRALTTILVPVYPIMPNVDIFYHTNLFAAVRGIPYSPSCSPSCRVVWVFEVLKRCSNYVGPLLLRALCGWEQKLLWATVSYVLCTALVTTLTLNRGGVVLFIISGQGGCSLVASRSENKHTCLSGGEERGSQPQGDTPIYTTAVSYLADSC